MDVTDHGHFVWVGDDKNTLAVLLDVTPYIDPFGNAYASLSINGTAGPTADHSHLAYVYGRMT